MATAATSLNCELFTIFLPKLAREVPKNLRTAGGPPVLPPWHWKFGLFLSKRAGVERVSITPLQSLVTIDGLPFMLTVTPLNPYGQGCKRGRM
jgi:hypothetical protein